ncbi:hypothetical protein DFH06DRAFT_472089 [Mycena polygramma]|nr:hypothetical protein DFH06DRAFT_472089 [Mycena polygramma]
MEGLRRTWSAQVHRDLAIVALSLSFESAGVRQHSEREQAKNTHRRHSPRRCTHSRQVVKERGARARRWEWESCGRRAESSRGALSCGRDAAVRTSGASCVSEKGTTELGVRAVLGESGRKIKVASDVGVLSCLRDAHRGRRDGGSGCRHAKVLSVPALLSSVIAETRLATCWPGPGISTLPEPSPTRLARITAYSLKAWELARYHPRS